MALINVYRWVASASLVSVMAVGSSTGQTPQSGDRANDGKANPPEITVVGCLVRTNRTEPRGDDAGRSRPAGSGRGSSSGFTLKDASVGTGAPAKGPVTTRSEREFGLQATKQVDFASHAGHQVEVKGRVAGTAGGDAADKGQPSKPEGTTLRVTALRDISDSCPARY